MALTFCRRGVDGVPLFDEEEARQQASAEFAFDPGLVQGMHWLAGRDDQFFGRGVIIDTAGQRTDDRVLGKVHGSKDSDVWGDAFVDEDVGFIQERDGFL